MARSPRPSMQLRAQRAPTVDMQLPPLSSAQPATLVSITRPLARSARRARPANSPRAPLRPAACTARPASTRTLSTITTAKPVRLASGRRARCLATLSVSLSRRRTRHRSRRRFRRCSRRRFPRRSRHCSRRSSRRLSLRRQPRHRPRFRHRRLSKTKPGACKCAGLGHGSLPLFPTPVQPVSLDATFGPCRRRVACAVTHTS